GQPRLWGEWSAGGCSSDLSGDGREQRREPRHIVANMQVEVAQPDVARRDALDADLGLQLRVLAGLGDGAVKRAQHGGRRLTRGENGRGHRWTPTTDPPPTP